MRRSIGCRATPALAAIVGVLVAGCSGGSSTPGQQSSGATSALNAASALAGIPVQASDLPSGWTAKTPDTKGLHQAAVRLDTCLGAKSQSAKRVDRAVGQDFLSKPASLTSVAAEYTTQAAVGVELGKYRNPRFDKCYESELRVLEGARLPVGITIAKVIVTIKPAPLRHLSNVVDVGMGQIVLASHGHHATLFADTAIITGPRILAQVSFESVGSRFAPDLEARLIKAVADRAAKA